MKTIDQTYLIAAPPERVWDALINPKTIKAWGGGPTVIDDQVGTAFTFWGGEIWGTNREVVSKHKLVQEWYGGKWPKPSRVTFTLSTKGNKTRVTLHHEDVPNKNAPDIAEGWERYYLGAIKRYLEQ